MKKTTQLTTIVLISLSNYKISKLVQTYLVIPNLDSKIVLVATWLLIGLVPALLWIKDSGLNFQTKNIHNHLRKILGIYTLLTIGLMTFITLGVTGYFHNVVSPVIFFLFTPLIEEVIFRGWIYGRVEQLTRYNPVIVTSILFGIHHLQYFNYSLTTFCIFQITYTFLLGLLLGSLRKYSKSIYLGLSAHILLNFAAIYL